MTPQLLWERRPWAWAGCGPAQTPPRCTKRNSPLINGQRTNFNVHYIAYAYYATIDGVLTRVKICIFDMRAMKCYCKLLIMF